MNRIALSVIAAGLIATTPAMATDKKPTTQQLNQQQLKNQNKNQNNNDIDLSQDGDKTDNLGLMIAPPAFSYGPGAAVGDCVATTSYAIGFPLIGGGYGEQQLDLMPGCVGQLKAVLDEAYKDQRSIAAACQSKFAKAALSSLNVDCDAVPVQVPE